ncbi:MAG: putative Adenosine kinase [Rickettsiales bacterium]|jgi:sugar/nucleoside kinase (ribokinase family)|nr:putative Adenosine kinase [Rickettsiales bacterium]
MVHHPEKFDVIGIGNALVDILTHVDDAFLAKHGIPKSVMQLVDEKTAQSLYQALPERVERSGGSAANTIAGIASFGGSAAFIGKVRDDVLGEFFKQDLLSIGVHYGTSDALDGESTGRCIVAVTPDAERSMSTYLGVAPHISSNDMDEALLSGAKVLYFEGYLWDRDDAKHAIRKAMHIGHKGEQDIAFSLSDPFCVSRHRQEFIDLIEEYVTILFANEEEVTMLMGADRMEDAVRLIRNHCDVACLTRGKKGSIIVAGEKVIEVPAQANIKVVDTTGAGDLYAAGFLYGYTQGLPLETCGKLGTIAATEVIQHLGARPETSLAELWERAKAA